MGPGELGNGLVGAHPGLSSLSLLSVLFLQFLSGEKLSPLVSFPWEASDLPQA